VKQTEVIKLIGLCSINYRNWPEDGKEELVKELWTKMLSDTSFEVAQVAIEKFLSESVYPPTIADIRQRIADITVIPEKTGIEAWGDVKQAIRQYGSYNEKKAMDSLRGVTRKVVEAVGFRTLCMSENEMADRAHFLKVYDNLDKREQEDSKLLLSTKESIQRIQGERQRRLMEG
jgi:hypothetical protein